MKTKTVVKIDTNGTRYELAQEITYHIYRNGEERGVYGEEEHAAALADFRNMVCNDETGTDKVNVRKG